jgi:hypothetical protein
LFNLRDQMRPEDLTPLQFRYEASDCRLYYAPKNVYNMSQLWRDAATATWDDTTLCVPDSTNYSKRTRTQRKPPPKPNSQASVHYTVSDIQLADPLEVSFNTSVGLMDSKTPPNLNTYQKCNSNNNICPASLVCAPAVASCNAVGDTTLYLCLQRCNTLQGLAGDCKPQQLAQSTAQQPIVKRLPQPQRYGPRLAGSAPAKPVGQLSGFSFPPKSSSTTVGQGVYNGYIQPGIVKASSYYPNSACSIV